MRLGYQFTHSALYLPANVEIKFRPARWIPTGQPTDCQYRLRAAVRQKQSTSTYLSAGQTSQSLKVASIGAAAASADAR